MIYIQEIMRYFIPGLIASLIFLCVSEIGQKVRNEKITWFQRAAVLLLGLYVTVIFLFTLQFEFSIHNLNLRNINLTPFHVFDTMSINPANFYGNILLFVPFGLLMVLCSNKCQKFYITLFAGAGLSLLIEALQIFGIRTADIDDVILNTAGTLGGYILGRILLLAVPSMKKKIGVMIKKDGKIIKKHNDAGRLVFLTLFVLISFIMTGYKEADHQIDSPKAMVPPITIKADIIAKNAYLWNLSSNTVLYEKESNQEIAPASTAKMLTAITAMDYCDEEDEVLVGPEVYLIAEDASRAWLSVGSRLNVHQLLNALLLPSGNDAAYTLAVYAGRKICDDQDLSEDEAITAFVAEMNRKAARIGATHSNFINPDGYDAEGQFTTAHDLACIAREFSRSKLLRNVAARAHVSDTWLSGQKVSYDNTNELILPDSQYHYEYATGLKTGKSEAAGCCLVSSVYINDELYLCVVMGSTEEGRWTDSLSLYRSIENLK